MQLGLFGLLWYMIFQALTKTKIRNFGRIEHYRLEFGYSQITVKKIVSSVNAMNSTADMQLESPEGCCDSIQGYSTALQIVVGKLGVGVLDQLAALDVDALIEKAGAARKKRQATGCPGVADCSKPDRCC